MWTSLQAAIIKHRQSQPLQTFAEWNKQAFKFKTIAHIHSLYLQYGSSTLAHSNICSYSWAALSQLLSRSIPRDCRSANESGWFLYVSRACPSVAVKASTVQGEKVQPVPVTVTQNTTVLLDSRAILYNVCADAILAELQKYLSADMHTVRTASNIIKPCYYTLVLYRSCFTDIVCKLWCRYDNNCDSQPWSVYLRLKTLYTMRCT